MERRLSVWPSGSMPGQKSIRLAKKGGGSSFPNAGFCALLPSYPFSPASLCGKEVRRKMGRFDPGPFCLRRLLFCPGNEKMGVIDQLKNWR